jgi:hypothetical protein
LSIFKKPSRSQIYTPSSDEAAETWERSRESVASRIMLATWDTDRAHWFGIGA